MSISLVAGLGNPGREYASTRHNLGWIVLDALAAKLGLAWKPQPQFQAAVTRWNRPGHGACWLVKPLTFMNDSGVAVGALARFHKLPIESVLVLYDDLNIDLGLVKVSVTGSAGGHNGLASVIEHFGDGFVRYRLGIGPKEPPQMDLKDFVLGKFTPDQQSLVTQNLPSYLSGLDLLLSRGVDAAMNQLNRRESK
ncbi:aminoacyl-tRNA hydrolase [Opitutus terrae]|uniref:Peptidyl-tRNA hydrolase n=1 Tax=Opitutus terrae (strain DSM 11246 / JCM 15787 / PB90-1) TaxID=452637 RepID=B1ZPW9_OPITP|nr:aminoacyl-tRNA hydrolase [Opitutus terrae]ACB75568.1 Aminoacyl-tRNA hydrolase [Opitutus terrae PB90-1]